MSNTRIRIKLKGFDYRSVDQSSKDIVETAKGPAPEFRALFPFLLVLKSSL